MNTEVTAIICAYNEENTLKGIIEEVYNSGVFSELILINDGSTDKTEKCINAFSGLGGIKIEHWPKNKGKGYAVSRGVVLAKNKYLVFIDADLSGFTNQHAQQLITPLLTGSVDMVLGQPGCAILPYRLNPFKNLTGQRALRRADILPLITNMKASGYGIETLLNLYYKKRNKTVEHVILIGLHHPTKFQKSSTIKALKEFAQEGIEIVNTIISNYRSYISARKYIISKN